MGKHITIIAKLSEEKDKVVCTIKRQSHRGYDFGTYGKRIFKHDGITIASIGGPLVSYSETTICLRGEYRSEDHKPFIIRLQTWWKLKAAIEAYNAYFKHY